MSELLARASLTRLFEPQDAVGLALVAVLGPEEALDLIVSGGDPDQRVEASLQGLLAEHSGNTTWKGLGAAFGRWRPRVPSLAPERDLMVLHRLGGGFLMPSDEEWPRQLDDLGLQAPLGLWFRGNPSLLPDAGRAVAVVGSRDSTAYGATVSADIAHGLARRGFTVVSGGAYGIDAHAHRAALAGADPGGDRAPTVAFMAGGLDRFYPSGNDELLRTVARRGLVLAEVPPGAAPTRYRFLQRNRMIAAFAGATVVVEARWRSGALNTAHHAEALGRPVAAVPGSVLSANSAGCHRLLRDGGAVLVTDVTEVLELLGGPPDSESDGLHRDEAAIQDGLTLEDLILLDALPLRTPVPPEKLCVVAGLSLLAVRAGLGRLQVLGLAESVGLLWRRGPTRNPA
ncbi:DNA processing protein [Arthrobacter woluwensis]|uniref:DNA-processing protein DprA n=1 Tax=Arthrobacter woluwensis TaxID=156980 RepID=UPI00277F6F98|nr:DNA-processing protein DprA [Arthrobacter woluwensis]MDQ0709148.1 DNA processing protein [Arthrobacter woluwensis]